MGNVSPHWDTADWDQLSFGGKVLPGVWDIDGSAERRVDVKTRKGQDGAIIKDEGYQNASVTLTGRFASKSDWDAMQEHLKVLHPRRKGAARDPLVLVHPAAAALGISASMGIVGGVLSALIAAGDASVSIRRVAICAMTTAMVSPAAVFGALEIFYGGSHHMIPVVCASGVAGVVTWPVADKLLVAFNGVSARAFGAWMLETARKLLGAR